MGTIAKTADVAAYLCEHGPLMTKPYDKQGVIDRINRLLAENGNNRELLYSRCRKTNYEAKLRVLSALNWPG